MYNLFSKKRGFTLVELLVVIAIIGILASIISVSLTSSRAKGRDAKRVADIRNLQLAIETYYNDNSTYPPSITTAPFYPNYMTKTPTDPSTLASYKYSVYNLNGSSNCASGNNAVLVRYHLAATMESSDQQGAPLPYNLALVNGDMDWSSGGLLACSGSAADFHGNGLNCSGSSANSYDNCYDVTN